MYCGPEPIADWYRDMAAHLKVGCMPQQAMLPFPLADLQAPPRGPWDVSGGGRGGGGCPSTFMAGPCVLQAQPGAADSQPPTSALLQSVDPNHLVSTGAEGFWDQSDPRAGAGTGGLLLLRGSSTCSAVCRCGMR